MNPTNLFLRVRTSPLALGGTALLGFLALFVGIFFATYDANPYISELAFIEHSKDSSQVGSVVPASCESTPPTNHFAGDCPIPPAPASITATCNAAGTVATFTWPLVTGATSYLPRFGSADQSILDWFDNAYTTNTFNASVAPGTTYSGWVHSQNVSGYSIQVATTVTCYAPVVATLTAAPSLVDSGNTSTLTWNVSDATTCTASGGWSGAKNSTGGTEVVTPTVSTTYTLTCSNPGNSITVSTTVRVPSGWLSASACTIPINASSCNSTIAWQGADFIGTSEISQGALVFSTLLGSLGTTRAVTPVNNTFTLEDTGGTFSINRTAAVTCGVGGVWVSALNICAQLPDVTINADPNVIRSSTSAEIDIEVDSTYPLTCTLKDGGVDQVFTHAGSALPQSYTNTTRLLTSAQIVSIECTSVPYPAISGKGETRVSVVPTIQEIYDF